MDNIYQGPIDVIHGGVQSGATGSQCRQTQAGYEWLLPVVRITDFYEDYPVAYNTNVVKRNENIHSSGSIDTEEINSVICQVGSGHDQRD